MFSAIGKFFGSDAKSAGEESPKATDVKLPNSSDVKLPLKEMNSSASPASTRAPENSPGCVTTPGTNLSTPDRRGGSEADFNSPGFSKGRAFLSTPHGSLEPFSASGPPGLLTDINKDSAVAPSSSPKGSPTAGDQPKLWPSTMSGDTLAQLIAAGEAAGLMPSSSPKKGVSKSPEGSPSARGGLAKPMFWPRTFSGDNLDPEFAEMAIAAAAAARELTKLPDGSPKSKQPMMWPRTMSGDDMADLEFAAQQALFAVAASQQNASAASGGANAAFLSTTPEKAPLHIEANSPPALPLKVSGSPNAASPGDSTSTSGGVSDATPAAAKSPAPPSAPPPSAAAPIFEEEALPPPPDAPASTPDAKKVSIADTLPEAEVGTEERPTIGSWGHSVGKCKPCAFYHTKGCTNGKECPFCHLCGRGEKKRRQREKWQAHREAVNVANVVQQQQHQAAILGMAVATTMSPLGMPAHLGMPPVSPLPGMPAFGMSPMPPMAPMMPGFGMTPPPAHTAYSP